MMVFSPTSSTRSNAVMIKSGTIQGKFYTHLSLIEDRNRIPRRYFPKKHNRSLTTRKGIDKVARKINEMPMKCLGYKTPADVFAKCGGVALAG
jgi:hypothetical protein